MTRRRPSQAQIERALEASRGTVAIAAQALGIHRNTLHRWLKGEGRDDLDLTRLDDYLDHQRELLLDHVEQQLYAAALKGSVDAQKFILGTRGKSRGYSLRTEITGANGGPIEVRALTPADADEIARAVYGAPARDG